MPEARSPEPEAGAGWNDMILVGRVARSHGLRGDVVVNPETDFVDERFRAGAALMTRSAAGDERLTIAAARVQQGRPIVRFDGIDGIEAADRLAGRELRIPPDQLTLLGPGAFYRHELAGCRVETTRGEVVGVVARVDGGAGGSLLIVQGRGGEILIPLAGGICVEVDVASKRIRVDPPEGLLELNERAGGRAG